MTKSFTARVKSGVATAVLAAASLPGSVNAVIQNTQINSFNPALPTISAQELKARIDAYDRGGAIGSAEVIKAATAGAKPNLTDPALLARVRSGDMSAILQLAGAQSRGGILTTTNSAPQDAAPSTGAEQQVPADQPNGKSTVPTVLLKALGKLQNPQSQEAGISEASQSSTTFPVNYNDAQDAVRLISNSRAKSVTISGLQSDGRSFNVVDQYGPYASKIQPLEKALAGGGNPPNTGSAPTYSQTRNAPSNVVTEAAGQAKNQNPNGTQ